MIIENAKMNCNRFGHGSGEEIQITITFPADQLFDEETQEGYLDVQLASTGNRFGNVDLTVTPVIRQYEQVEVDLPKSRALVQKYVSRDAYEIHAAKVREAEARGC